MGEKTTGGKDDARVGQKAGKGGWRERGLHPSLSNEDNEVSGADPLWQIPVCTWCLGRYRTGQPHTFRGLFLWGLNIAERDNGSFWRNVSEAQPELPASALSHRKRKESAEDENG